MSLRALALLGRFRALGFEAFGECFGFRLLGFQGFWGVLGPLGPLGLLGFRASGSGVTVRVIAGLLF